MAGTTTNIALRYPSSTDADNVPTDMQNLATDVDTVLSKQGLAASRPAAGHKGALYYSTDLDKISRDDGTAWHDFPSRAVTDAAYLALVGGTLTGELVLPDLSVSGLTGSVQASRYVGATTSGAPTTGAHLVGDWIIDRTGKIWICTTAGTPGTWTQVGGSAAAVSGQRLAFTSYNPTTGTQFSTTSTSLVAVSAANATVSFVAPASGNVLVRVEASAYTGATGTGFWSLFTHSTTTQVATAAIVAGGAFQQARPSLTFSITGLTPGNTYQYDLAQATFNASQSMLTNAGGPASGTSGTAYGPLLMEVTVA